MAEKGKFVIEEMPQLGGRRPRTGSPVKLEWTAEKQSIPTGGWTFGVQQRTNRTEYPGASEPTEQIMGPNFTPFTLAGTWKDRYNFDGYSVDTWRVFEDLVRRGNVVALSFDKIYVTGIIINAEFNYRRYDEIGYSFTFSPHKRKKDKLDIRAPKDGPPNVAEATFVLTQGLEDLSNRQKPSEPTVGVIDPELAAQVQLDVANIGTAVNDLSALSEEGAASLELKKARGAVDNVIKRANESKVRMSALRADLTLNYQTAINSLEFETWSRGTSANARQMIFDSQRVREQLDRADNQDALAFRIAKKGESLYGISNHFYGTPHNARQIAERNGIQDMTLLGGELLVIPVLK